MHGIRTFGEWQTRLAALIGEERADVRVYRYGYFSSLAFAIPPLRFVATRRFRSALVSETSSLPEGSRVDIVAHSFGTHLVAFALRGLPRSASVRIHTLILAGSVLRSAFPWAELLATRVHRLVNDCGIHDNILVLSQVFILLTGMAGRMGFYGMESSRFTNRYFSFGHSGYFVDKSRPSDSFMATHWLPLLLTDAATQRIDERAKPSLFSGFATTVINNAEPVKLCLYSALPLLLLFTFMRLYYRSEDQRLSLAATLAEARYTQSSTRLRFFSDPLAASLLAAESVSHGTTSPGVAYHAMQHLLSRAGAGLDFAAGARLTAYGARLTELLETAPDPGPKIGDDVLHSAYLAADGRTVLILRSLDSYEVIPADSGHVEPTPKWRYHIRAPHLPERAPVIGAISRDASLAAVVISAGRERGAEGGRTFVRVWRVESATTLVEEKTHISLFANDVEIGEDMLPRLVFSGDGHALVLTQGAQAYVWNLQEGGAFTELADNPTENYHAIEGDAFINHDRASHSAAFTYRNNSYSRNGEAESSTSVAIVDLIKGSVRKLFEVPTASRDAVSLAFSPKGTLLASVSEEALPDGQVMCERGRGDLDDDFSYQLDRDCVEARAEAQKRRPPGRRTRRDDPSRGSIYRLRLWDVTSGMEVSAEVPFESSQRIKVVDVSVDDRLILTAPDLGFGFSEDSVRVWDARSGAFYAIPVPSWGSAHFLRLGPRGESVVSVGQDRILRVFDVQTGREVAPPRWLGPGAIDYRLTPNRHRLAVLYDSGNVRWWPILVERRVRQARLSVDSPLTDAFASPNAGIFVADRGMGIKRYDGRGSILWSSNSPAPGDLLLPPGKADNDEPARKPGGMVADANSVYAARSVRHGGSEGCWVQGLAITTGSETGRVLLDDGVCAGIAVDSSTTQVQILTQAERSGGGVTIWAWDGGSSAHARCTIPGGSGASFFIAHGSHVGIDNGNSVALYESRSCREVGRVDSHSDMVLAGLKAADKIQSTTVGMVLTFTRGDSWEIGPDKTIRWQKSGAPVALPPRNASDWSRTVMAVSPDGQLTVTADEYQYDFHEHASITSAGTWVSIWDAVTGAGLSEGLEFGHNGDFALNGAEARRSGLGALRSGALRHRFFKPLSTSYVTTGPSGAQEMQQTRKDAPSVILAGFTENNSNFIAIREDGSVAIKWITISPTAWPVPLSEVVEGVLGLSLVGSDRVTPAGQNGAYVTDGSSLYCLGKWFRRPGVLGLIP